MIIGAKRALGHLGGSGELRTFRLLKQRYEYNHFGGGERKVREEGGKPELFCKDVIHASPRTQSLPQLRETIGSGDENGA